MNILYIPLDERPCNYDYPQMIADLKKGSVQLITPPKSLLSQKKKKADVEKLWEWLFEQVPSLDSAILSIEMMVYGGLLPSRLHHSSTKELLDLVENIKKIKALNPSIKIYASNLIMRTPHYDSSEEEPDYYGEYGERIFQIAYLKDKKERESLSKEENVLLSKYEEEVPEEIIKDYSERRLKNVKVNLEVINFTKEGYIDFLSIPQDDSSPYGYTAIDQKTVVSKIIKERLQKKVHMYPGADEVGCTLLSRAFNEKEGSATKVFLLYSSVNSENIIPLYEDRPIGESVKSHIQASGCEIVSSPDQADFILGINTAGKIMMEAWDNPIKDITYSSFRNLRFFVEQIKTYQEKGHSIVIADVAFANGGETELVNLLDDYQCLDQLDGYYGWNTNCNTLGTSICTGVFASEDRHAIQENVLFHLAEDWAYQSIIRMDTVKNFLPTIDASYYIFNGKDKVIHQHISDNIKKIFEDTFIHSFKGITVDEVKVSTPWNRMFEIGLDLSISHK